jgi:epoxyqueuosine reductase
MNPVHKGELIKKWAQEAGFLQCGVAKAQQLPTEAKRLEKWLNKGYHGKMSYLENHFEKRVDPTLLVDNAKSVISLSYNYFPPETQNPHSPQIAKYAYGKDYHFVIKEKLANIIEQMQSAFGDFNYRVFVDSGPVLERAWAEKAGLGWIGKHGLLINKKQGSFFFLAEIICDLEIFADTPNIKDHCGTCNACVDACPTNAILPDKSLNATQCISYLTIELKEQVPNDLKDKLSNWAFGCDICQDVCPWNKFSTPHKEEAFIPHPDLLSLNKQEWQELSHEIFKDLFKKSAVKRAGFTKLKNTISLLK